MKHFAVIACISAGAMLAGGCATKKYVRNTTAPIQSKVDQVSDQSNRQGQSIEQSKTRIEEVNKGAETGISGAKEAAMTAQNKANEADTHAGEAMTKANQANEAAAKVVQDLGSLRTAVANLDDYKVASEVSIPFRFDKYGLTEKDKQDLDNLVTNLGSYKRYFIAVEGFTDRTGAKAYNEELSRKRADAVVEYLVAKHDVPIYRIHRVGLADEKPADTGRTRAARAKNRRVEVKVFSADQATASLGGSPSNRPATTR